MPGFERAELTAELKVLPSGEGEAPGQIEAAKTAAGETGLAHEAGPEQMVLAGGRKDVLEATMRVVEAALDAGARGVEVAVEAEAQAGRFDQA